jgi:hypothetical protein
MAPTKSDSNATKSKWSKLNPVDSAFDPSSFETDYDLPRALLALY